MTEPVSPFGAQPQPVADGMTTEFDGSGDGNRRKLVLVGAVVAVLILGAAAYFLLLKGNSSPSTAASSVPVVHPTTGGSPSTSGSKGGNGSKSTSVTLPKVNRHPVGHDPFAALVSTPATPAASSGGSGTSGTTSQAPQTITTPQPQPTSTNPVVVIGPTTPTSTAPVTTPTSPSPSPSPTKTHTAPAPVVATFLQFDHASAKKATFTIFYSNGEGKAFRKIMSVNAPSWKKLQTCDPNATFCGTRFAKIFGLMSITDEKSVSVQIGDSVYSLKKGQRIAVPTG